MELDRALRRPAGWSGGGGVSHELRYGELGAGMRRGREMVFFGHWALWGPPSRTPIFHRAVMENSWQVSGPSVCGKETIWLEEDGYGHGVWIGIDMPRDRAEAIGRPCKICFPEARHETNPSESVVVEHLKEILEGVIGMRSRFGSQRPLEALRTRPHPEGRRVGLRLRRQAAGPLGQLPL